MLTGSGIGETVDFLGQENHIFLNLMQWLIHRSSFVYFNLLQLLQANSVAKHVLSSQRNG